MLSPGLPLVVHEILEINFTMRRREDRILHNNEIYHHGKDINHFCYAILSPRDFKLWVNDGDRKTYKTVFESLMTFSPHFFY